MRFAIWGMGERTHLLLPAGPLTKVSGEQCLSDATLVGLQGVKQKTSQEIG